jgi:2-oxoglutarate ferredoxin oxidoreductase subunit delta
MSPPERAAEPGKTPKKTSRKKKEGPPPEINIKVSWCKGCGLCVDYCNAGTLEMEGVVPVVVAPEKCNECLQCEAICPDFCIEVSPGEAKAVPAGGKAS